MSEEIKQDNSQDQKRVELQFIKSEGFRPTVVQGVRIMSEMQRLAHCHVEDHTNPNYHKLIEIVGNMEGFSDKYDFKISDSKIHGQGLFANCDIKKEAIIMEAVNIMRLPILNRPDLEITDNFMFVNHSEKPNTAFIRLGTNYYLLSNKDIEKGEELTVNYEMLPWFIDHRDVKEFSDKQSPDKD